MNWSSRLMMSRSRGNSGGYTAQWSVHNSNSMADDILGSNPRSVVRCEGRYAVCALPLRDESTSEAFFVEPRRLTTATTSSAGRKRSCSNMSSCSFSRFSNALMISSFAACLKVWLGFLETYVHSTPRAIHLPQLGRLRSHYRHVRNKHFHSPRIDG